MAKEVAKVYYLTCKDGLVSDLRSEIMRAARHAKETNEKNVPVVILAGECSLSYRFNIRDSAMQRHIRNIQKDLPQDMWIAVAFSAFVREGLDFSNTAYFFTRDKTLSQPKRRTPPVEVDEVMKQSLGTYYERFKRIKSGCGITEFDSNVSIINKKIKKGMDLSAAKTPFIAHTAPNGQEFQYRLCADIFEKPFWVKNAFTIVSSNLLRYDLSWHFTACPVLFINDSSQPAVSYPKDEAYAREWRKNDGTYSVSVTKRFQFKFTKPIWFILDRCFDYTERMYEKAWAKPTELELAKHRS